MLPDYDDRIIPVVADLTNAAVGITALEGGAVAAATMWNGLAAGVYNLTAPLPRSFGAIAVTIGKLIAVTAAGVRALPFPAVIENALVAHLANGGRFKKRHSRTYSSCTMLYWLKSVPAASDCS